MSEGGEPFDWNAFVPHIVHPLKVAIVEALWWIDMPLSASDLTKIVDNERFGLSHVSYHVVGLTEAGVIKKVRQRQARGATEKFYFFTTSQSRSAAATSRSRTPRR